MYTVLITGASGGIGAQFARLYAWKGTQLILVARGSDKLTKTKEDLERTSDARVMIIEKDLSVPHAAQEVFHTVQQAGFEVDLLINNAGVGSFGPFSSSDWVQQEQMIQLNVIALAELTRLFLPEMTGRKQGKIINVASTAAFEPGPLMSVYYASKAFVLSFSEALSRELKGSGVTVTALCPGPTDTGFAAAASLKKSKTYKLFKFTPAFKVAQYGVKSANKGKAVAVYGIFNKVLVFLVRLLPRRFVRNMIFKLQGKEDQ